MSTQIILIIGTVLVFALLGFMMSRSIKKYEEKKAKEKKKKGRIKYMPQTRLPGKK